MAFLKALSHYCPCMKVVNSKGQNKAETGRIFAEKSNKIVPFGAPTKQTNCLTNPKNCFAQFQSASLDKFSTEAGTTFEQCGSLEEGTQGEGDNEIGVEVQGE